jgi:Protein of unknown function (DUF1580)
MDMEKESLIRLAQAAQELPGRPHLSTVVRWSLRGIKGVRLETVVVGGRRFTSREAIRRFHASLNQTVRIVLSETRNQQLSKTAVILDANGL